MQVTTLDDKILDFLGDLWYNKNMRRWKQRRLFFVHALRILSPLRRQEWGYKIKKVVLVDA